MCTCGFPNAFPSKSTLLDCGMGLSSDRLNRSFPLVVAVVGIAWAGVDQFAAAPRSIRFVGTDGFFAADATFAGASDCRTCTFVVLVVATGLLLLTNGFFFAYFYFLMFENTLKLSK